MSRALLSELRPLASRLRACERLVLALDFDGTLAPIAPHPANASIPQRTLNTLRRLGASDKVSVVIVSGRSVADLKQRLNLDAIHVGNHGLEIEARGFSFVRPEAGFLRGTVASACDLIEEALRGIPGVFVERKVFSASVHYRQTPADLHGWIEASVRLTMRPWSSRLELLPARKAWEIRPRTAWNKGSAMKLVMDRAGIRGSTMVCAGDDLTDEDLFAAFPDAISIKVGAGPTGARYRVANPLELAGFLELLLSGLPEQPAEKTLP